MLTARRTASAAVATATLAGGALTTAGSAHAAAAPADTTWNLSYDASATTTIKKMNQSSRTTGTATSQYNLQTGSLTTDLRLKEFKAPVKVAGIQLAIATIAQEPVGKATGSVDPVTHQITQTQKAYLHIKDISPLGKGLINLVGKNCRTAAPVNLKVTGQLKGLFDPITLSGSYEIPKFTGCGVGGILDSVVSSQVSGPGNPITLTLKPRA